MKIPTNHPLSLEGREAVLALMRSRLSRPLDERFVSLQVDAPASQLVVTALDTSLVGETGIYSGEIRLNYSKIDLTAALPYPIHYSHLYPLSLRRVRQYLQETYNLWLDDGEFGLTVDAAVGLEADDLVNTSPDSETNEVRLYALLSSKRCQAGSYLRLLVVGTGTDVALGSLLNSDAVGSLDALAYP